jgi:hypothetical protein
MTASKKQLILKQFKFKKKIVVKFQSMDKAIEAGKDTYLTSYTIPTIQINTIYC